MAETTLNPRVQLGENGLTAEIIVPTPTGEAQKLTRAYLLQLLSKAGVIFGVDPVALNAICDRPTYDKPMLVATGKAPVEGTPGYFEYHFDTNPSKKPIIREDGTTDYMNIKNLEIVYEGDKIATYHPCVQGVPGVSVRGREIAVKPVRDLPPIPGRGFVRSADNLEYTAAIDGKISLTENRIIISPVYEVDGDANITTGNITFNGDVVIHGGATDGVIIKAAGNVTVEGLVESCEIHAGGDVYVKTGIKGSVRTLVDAAGCITTQFIEYAVINCEGDLNCDVIFKSRVNVAGRVNLSGKKSSIIGGYTAAIAGVDVNVAGNDFGTTTRIQVGVSPERLRAIRALKDHIQALSDNVNKIKAGMQQIDAAARAAGVDNSTDPKRLSLLRVRMRDEAIIEEEKDRLEKLEDSVRNATNPTLRVFGTVYSGVDVAIDDRRLFMKDYQTGVEFVKSQDGIRMEKLGDVVV